MIMYNAAGNVLDVDSIYKGKKLSIFGDSLSTFTGWIPPGNATYYNGSNAGVPTVNDTWWKKVIDALDLDLVVNNSWSGRAVSNCRDSESAHSTDAAYKEANVLALKNGDIVPEVIIVKLGSNDFLNGAHLGTYDGSTPVPSDPTIFADAYAIMLNLIMTNFPRAEIWCCTLIQEERLGDRGFPEVNDYGESLGQWNDKIRQLALAFGAKVMDHAVCGIEYQNIDIYMGDYNASKHTGLHPNAAGHSLMANYTIQQMDNAVRIRYE